MDSRAAHDATARGELARHAVIACFVADRNMSILDGSIGILPRRVMIDADEVDRARRILTDAGIANELRSPDA